MNAIFSIVLTLVPSLCKLAKLVLVVSVWTCVLMPAVSHQRKDDKFYTVADDEFTENTGLLPGETAPGLGVEDIPVRLLDDFTVYNWDTLCLVPISDLLDLGPGDAGVRYGASGLVKPWTDDGSDDDSDDDTSPVAIKLSHIVELNVHDFSPSTGSLDA